MFPLILTPKPGQPIQILCLGAHADDIEIGCGGTILKLLAERYDFTVRWIIFSADAERRCEAEKSASLFLEAAMQKTVLIRNFRDGFFPYTGAEIKEYFEELKQEIVPDLIFTHYRDDRHQDHRLISDLTWNTYRNHLIFEYEIPKYDGDLGSPNCFVPLAASICQKKIQLLRFAFSSQKEKHWFDKEVFLGLMRLRGMEAGGQSQYAEAFYTRKIVLGS